MALNSNCDEKARSYFASLPKNIQETIMQTGISFSSEEELKQIYEQLAKKE